MKENLLEGYKTEAEVAPELKVHIRTLQKWRYQQIGPEYVRTGRDVIYSDQKVRAWLAAGGTNASAKAKRRGRRARRRQVTGRVNP